MKTMSDSLTIITVVAIPMFCLFLVCCFGCCQSKESLEERTLSDLHERMKRRRRQDSDPSTSSSKTPTDTFNNRRAKHRIRRQQVSDSESKEKFNDRRDLKILSKLYFQKLSEDTIGLDPRIFRQTHKEFDRIENILKGNIEEAEKALDVESGPGLNNLSPSPCCSSNFECPICLSEYIPGDVICIAKKPVCDHMYHIECIVEWLQKQSCCPLCRNDLMH